MERVVDLQPGQIGHDPLRDGIDRTLDRNPMADDVQCPATFDAGRGLVVDELDRDLDGHGHAVFDAEKINVHDPFADRMTLEIAGQGTDFFRTGVDCGDAGVKAASVDSVLDVAFSKGDCDRGFLAAVHDGRDSPVTTGCAGGPLAHLFANRRRELVVGAHRDYSFKDKNPPLAGDNRRVASRGVGAAGGV